MKRIVLTSAIILGLSAPAFAQSQLERSLNLEAGAYTLSQQVQILAARQSDDSHKTAYIPSNATASSMGSTDSDALRQLERSLNVEAGTYSLSQLVELGSLNDQDGGRNKVYLGDKITSPEHDARIAAIFSSIADEETGSN